MSQVSQSSPVKTWGRRDFSTQPARLIAGPLRAHFPQAQIETILESGHNPHMETREAFLRIVRTMG